MLMPELIYVENNLQTDAVIQHGTMMH